MADDAKKDDIVCEAIDAYEAAADAHSDNHDWFKEDIRFARLGEQWPDTIKKERIKSGRPCLVINKLQPVIRQVVNDARQNRPSTNVLPCDSAADPETAKVLAGMIRNIEAASDADIAYDTAVDNAVSGGFGFWEVAVDYAVGSLDEVSLGKVGPAAFEKDILIKAVPNPLSVLGDPNSTGADSSDWMQAHKITSLTKDQFRAKYKGAKETDFEADCWREAKAPWLDSDNVQVAAYWKREAVEKEAVMLQMPDSPDMPGETLVLFADDNAAKEAIKLGATVVASRKVKSFKVTQHVVSGVEELEKVEWAGAFIPIIPVYGDEVNLEGKRYLRSLIRDSKDAQQNFNYWRTTATETVALQPRVPFIAEEGSLVDVRKWSTANAQSHAYLEFKKGMQPPQRSQAAVLPTGMMQEALSAADDIKSITGIYDASLGARSNETSGRAIMARQREGDVSTFHFIDNLTRAIRHSGRVIVDLIPKVYSDERIVRILGEDGSAETKQINKHYDDKGVLRMHDVRTGRYDVAVSAGPGFTTRREEAAQQMMDLIQSFPDAAPVIGDLLAKNLDWPGADEIAERLKKMLPPGIGDDGEGGIDPQVQQQMQQMAQALQQMQQQLQEAEGKRDLEQLKLSIESYKAETERMTALAPAFGPEQISAVVQQTLAEIASNVLPNAEGAPAGPGSYEQPEMGQAA